MGWKQEAPRSWCVLQIDELQVLRLDPIHFRFEIKLDRQTISLHCCGRHKQDAANFVIQPVAGDEISDEGFGSCLEAIEVMHLYNAAVWLLWNHLLGRDRKGHPSGAHMTRLGI